MSRELSKLDQVAITTVMAVTLPLNIAMWLAWVAVLSVTVGPALAAWRDIGKWKRGAND